MLEDADQLARANDLVSRYVAAQVTEQIMAGNYEAVNRHDRRRLTIFFSDIKGFSVLADRLEPEDISEFMNDYLSEMTGIAQAHGATIDKFIVERGEIRVKGIERAVRVYEVSPMVVDQDRAGEEGS